MELRHATPAQLFRMLLTSHTVYAEDDKLWGKFTTADGTEALVVITIEERK